jgi:hypothetical protein
MTSTTPELKRLQVLRAFKQRMPQAELAENVSPFDDRIIRCHGTVTAFDLAGIHAAVRHRIAHTIKAVHRGDRKSQVILLAGDAGTGKSHLLRTFQTPEMTDQLGFVYVGGSNQWSINDFHAQLLDWMIESLTGPSPAENHLLLDRLQAIGFRAVDHLLGNAVTWRQCLARPKGGLLERVRARLFKPSREMLKKKVDAHDPTVFQYLDFTKFSQYVCDRFLADKSNPIHRYALRVLLKYLFPDQEETGVGTRDRVINWFRRKPDDGYFRKQLGVVEPLDQQFAVFQAVKLLVHLFSPAVSKELSTEDHPAPPRVCLLVFDQAEGRNELFKSDEDWKDFFAQLGELYGSLPNVVVLFTMTLILRKRLHSLMERQFRDRIRMDDDFVLRLPDEEQTLELYRSRIEHWLQDDPILLEQYRSLDNPYEPFNRDKVLEIAGQESIRVMLEEFDRAFHDEMGCLVIDPSYDFHFCLGDLLKQERNAKSEFDYTADHLRTIRGILARAREWLTREYRLTLNKIGEVSDGSPATLWLEFSDSTDSNAWVCTCLAKLTFKNVQLQLDEATKVLANKQKARYTLWPLRTGDIKATFDPKRKDQIFPQVTPPALESRLRGILHVIGKQKDYEQAGHWSAAQELIHQEIAGTYLAELFRETRKRLDSILSGNSPNPSDTSEVQASTDP